MSGGYFQYDQFKIGQIANDIEKLIYMNDSTEVDDYGDAKGNHFSSETIAKFREALIVLRKAAFMAHRIDWLVSGDDGENTFNSQWNNDLAKLEIE